MPDPQTLYAIAAVIGALSPIAVAAIAEAGRLLRSRRGRGDHPGEQPDQ